MTDRNTTARGGRSPWHWAATLALMLTLLGGNFAQVAGATAPPKDQPKPPSGPHAPPRSGAHSAAVAPGNVYAWGSNSDGQLGDGTEQYDDRYVPTLTVGIGEVIDIAAGEDFTLAATADGAAYAWGDGYNGELGIGDGPPGVPTGTDYDYPMQIVAPGDCPAANTTPDVTPGACGYLTGVVAVAAGNSHGLALQGDGTVYAWGANSSGQLGIGTTTGPFDRPRQVHGVGDVGPLTGIVAIAAGEDFSVALQGDGTVYAWGANGDGELGDGTTTDRTAPVQVHGVGDSGFLTGVTAISVDEEGTHVVALKDGGVYAWGSNGYGELGDGSTTARPAPVRVLGVGGVGLLDGIKGIGAGEDHSLALKADGTVYAWGENAYGELGDGTTTDRTTPVQVLGPNGVGVLTSIAQVAGGYSHSLALTTDGRVFAWGEGDYGEIGDGLGLTTNVYPRAVRNPQGPGQLRGIAFVAAGDEHSLAIASATASPSATGLDFGDRQLGTTGPAQTATITNGGGGPLTINGVTLDGAAAGDFATTGGCAGVVAPGASCSINVTFAPTATGARAATLTFATSVGPTALVLTGNGTPVPVPSPSPSPVALHSVIASATGSGTISPVGTTSYDEGTIASYTATAAAGQTFAGWALDGQYVGYASPLTFTVAADRTLAARFVATPAFDDLGGLGAEDRRAITFLAALGIINPNGVNGSHQFQPNADVKRAEIASFVARTFGWQQEFHRNNFPDMCDQNGGGCVDDELWNNVAALADYGIVGGYTAPGTCAAAGTASPCYLPRDPVLRVQVVSIVARAFIKTPDLRPTGFWDRLAANPGQYTNLANEGTQRSDLATYRANAGEIPGQTGSFSFANPEANGTRLFVIQVLYQAYDAQFGVDRVP